MNKRRRTAKARKAAAKKQRNLIIGGFGGVLLLLVGFLAIQPRATNQPLDPASLEVAPKVNAIAPDFSLNNLDGKQISLSDFEGQLVAVTFMHTW